MKSHFRSVVFALAFLSVSASQAWSGTVTFTGGDAAGRSASAVFTTTAGGLHLKLTNGATAAAVPDQVLTAIFFKITNAGGPVVATSAFGDYKNIATGELFLNKNIGNEWAYRSDFNLYGTTHGVSSTGLGHFGTAELIDADINNDGIPDNYSGPYAPNGMQFGIIPVNHTGGNGGMTGQNGTLFVLGSANFTFTAPVGFDVNRISNVLFQYGTGLSEPRFSGDPSLGTPPVVVPSPASVSGGLALLAASALARRRWSAAV